MKLYHHDNYHNQLIKELCELLTPNGMILFSTILSDGNIIQNINYSGGAGSITAAQFLQRFLKNKTPWAHLDIAGMAWTKKDLDIIPTGATGFGVKLLNKLVEKYYE